MADPEMSPSPEPDTGAVALSPQTQTQTRGLALEDLRPHLPGLEPDRHVTDWGRSERVEGVVDRTLYDFLYHYWFRVAVEGIENVPGEGPALLVANHAGAAAPSAAMIVKAIRQEHPRPRPVHFITAPNMSDMPAIGTLVTKVGGVPNHPANLHRLLFDEHQLVLGFPESTGAGAKPIKDRYRLRQFDGGGLIETAVQAAIPVVPMAVVGAEEAVPVLGHLSFLRRLTRIPSLRIAPTLPLPAKFRIRFLEAVDTAGLPGGASSALQGLGHDIRALIQENLLEMLAQRRSVWLG
jgi:1-acyl-sn-glycerol-3-phosphate acyltransferase